MQITVSCETTAITVCIFRHSVNISLFSIPTSATAMSETVLNVSSVHLSFKQKYRGHFVVLADLPWSLLSIIPLSKVCMTASEKSNQYGVTVSLYTLKLIQIMVSCEAISVIVCLIFPEKLHSADISLFSIPISATAVSKSHFAWNIEDVKQCGSLNLELLTMFSVHSPETSH